MIFLALKHLYWIKYAQRIRNLTGESCGAKKDVFNLIAKVGCYENGYLNKAFAEVKGSKLMIQDDKVNVTFIVDTMSELVELLSRKYYLHLFKD